MPEAPRGPKLYLDITRTRIVPEGSPEAAVMVHERDAKAMGIDVSKKAQAAAIAPPPEPEPEPTPEPEPEPELTAMSKARRGAADK